MLILLEFDFATTCMSFHCTYIYLSLCMFFFIFETIHFCIFSCYCDKIAGQMQCKEGYTVAHRCMLQSMIAQRSQGYKLEGPGHTASSVMNQETVVSAYFLFYIYFWTQTQRLPLPIFTVSLSTLMNSDNNPLQMCCLACL